jgi:hypothetical protein
VYVVSLCTEDSVEVLNPPAPPPPPPVGSAVPAPPPPPPAITRYSTSNEGGDETSNQALPLEASNKPDSLLNLIIPGAAVAGLELVFPTGSINAPSEILISVESLLIIPVPNTDILMVLY